MTASAGPVTKTLGLTMAIPTVCTGNGRSSLASCGGKV
jgi:hypothetical protein